MKVWVLFLAGIGICLAGTPLFDWCPPKHLRPVNESFRTSIITEIHGKIIEGGRRKSFLPAHQLSRFFYYHIGVFGFDNVHLNILYNPELLPGKPSLETIYPRNESCVAAWYNTGRIVLHHIEHGGPEEKWPLSPEGVPTLVKNTYRTTRGINPVFNGKFHLP